MSGPAWPTLDDLIAFNRLEVSSTDEPFALLDRGALESALHNPQNKHHYDGENDILALAVALMVAIARNHPFEQGNKRTAFDAGVMLLELNGYTLGEDFVGIATAFVGVINRNITQHAFADYLFDFVVTHEIE